MQRPALLPTLVILVALAGCASTEEPSGGETGTVAFAITDAPTDDFAKVEVTISRVAIHRSSGPGDASDADTSSSASSTDASTSTASASPTGMTGGATTTPTGDGATATLDSDGGGPTGGWITLVSTAQTVDLIALHRNGTAQTLGLKDVEAGHYQQVRFYVDRVVGTYHNGTQVEMTVPSGVVRTSGSFDVEARGNTTITVEIDLDRSISCRDNGARAGACTFRTHIGRVTTDEAE